MGVGVGVGGIRHRQGNVYLVSPPMPLSSGSAIEWLSRQEMNTSATARMDTLTESTSECA